MFAGEGINGRKKTIKAYDIRGENVCYIYTGTETCVVDFVAFRLLDRNAKHYKYIVENILNRTNVIAFIQYMFCDYVAFVDVIDIDINKKLFQRAKDISEKVS